MTVKSRSELNPAAVRFDKVLPRNQSSLPIRSLNQDIRMNMSNEVFGSIITENGHVVHGLEGSQNKSARILILNRTERTLDVNNGDVRIETNYQDITKDAGVLKGMDMPRMQEVKTSVRKHDLVTMFAMNLKAFEKGRKLNNLAGSTTKHGHSLVILTLGKRSLKRMGR